MKVDDGYVDHTENNDVYVGNGSDIKNDVFIDVGESLIDNDYVEGDDDCNDVSDDDVICSPLFYIYSC